MVLPPNLVRTILAATTSAVANTVVSAAIIAAPGSGFRYRVWAFWAGPSNTAQVPTNWRVDVHDHAGTSGVLLVTGSGFASPPMQWIPGGSPISGNAALDYTHQSALASLALLLVVYTTLEAT